MINPLLHEGSGIEYVADTTEPPEATSTQTMWAIAADDTRVVAVGIKNGIAAMWTAEVTN